MSLFVCDWCETVENTATSRYWQQRRDREDRRLCSACDPRTVRGESGWHGLFPRERWDGDTSRVVNR